MAEHLQHHYDEAALTERPDSAIGGIAGKGLVTGAIGGLALIAGAFLDFTQFLQSYLVGYLFVLCLVLGCLALMMVHHLTGGAWGMVCRRIWEAATRTLPIVALLFIPIALNLDTLYSWARPEAAADPIIAAKAPYLNEPFFYLRAVLFFAIWGALIYFLNRWSKDQDAGAALPPGPADSKFRTLSGPGLVLFVLTVTFMSVDWIMSLDPHWYSTMFGVIFIGGQGLGGIAFSILVLGALAHTRPFANSMTVEQLHDLGKLLLAFVMLWAYFSFSQFLLIYAANLAEEVPFYIERFRGGWGWLSFALALFHFILPFTLLLSADIKKDRRKIMMVAGLVLAARAIDLIWHVGPMFHHEAAMPIHWMDIAAIVGIGGIWLFVFARALKTRALLPYKDPYFKEAIYGAH